MVNENTLQSSDLQTEPTFASKLRKVMNMHTHVQQIRPQPDLVSWKLNFLK